MKTSLRRIGVCLVVMVLAGAGLFSLTGKAVYGASSSAPDVTAAGQYCTQNGGIVERRRPIYGSNGSDPLPLSGFQEFCQFTASDSSRIHVLLGTLYTQQPTLAALAYYAQTQPGSCTANPASCYCSLLGGSDLFGGISAAGGGWYLQGSIDETLEACIMPDMSTIDSWGLFYHSAGIIRGKDLSTVLRYPNPYKK